MTQAKRSAMAVAVAVLVAGGAYSAYRYARPHPLPPGVIAVDGALASLRDDFNAAADRPRLLALVSPT
jgi:hypothetical protein